MSGARGAEYRPTLSHRFEYAGLRSFSALFSLLPESAALLAGDLLGRFAHDVVAIRRAVAEENLRAAFPDWTPAERRDTLRRMYRHFGRNLAEFARFPVMTRAGLDRCVRLEGEHHLKAALAPGRGVLLLSAHLGNWEILGATLAAHGYPVTLLVGPQRNRLVQDLFTAFRRRHQVEVLVRGHDLRGIFRALAAGRVVATVGDQDAGPGGYFVEFLNRPASTALGPYRIARRAGAPLLIGYGLREGRIHVAQAEPPLWPDPARDPGEEAEAWSRQYHAVLETLIRRRPEQWFWVHRRWRSRVRPTTTPDPPQETADRASRADAAPPAPPPSAIHPR